MGWLTVRTVDLAFTGATPREFASSPGVLRSFCGRCGTPLTYRHEGRPGEVDVTVCTLDDPSLAAPTDHIWMQDAPAWDTRADGLPRYLQGRQGKSAV